MRNVLILFVVLSIIPIGVNASEFTAPSAPAVAEKYMPAESGNFIQDLWHVITTALEELYPHIKNAVSISIALIATTLLISLLQVFSGVAKQTVELVGTLVVSLLLLESTNTLVALGVETVRNLCQYGKLLLPVMTAALAAQGGTTTSAALYTGTAFFNTFLSSAIELLAIPMIYFYLAAGIATNAFDNSILQSIKKFIKWLLTWTLKISIYLFTGYLGITRVINGTADASAIKATKLALSGMVPIIGKLISDASETILVSAEVMKNAAGIYGLITISSICIAPFLRIGLQYIILKFTGSICSVLGCKSTTHAIDDFSCAVGYLLAITGTVGILLFISTVCFMKGVK